MKSNGTVIYSRSITCTECGCVSWIGEGMEPDHEKHGMLHIVSENHGFTCSKCGAQASPHIFAMLMTEAERQRQDRKWGQQNHVPLVWLPILMEEVGEYAQALNETIFNNGPEEQMKGGYANIMAELSQVAAVAEAAMECLRRNHGKGDGHA